MEKPDQLEKDVQRQQQKHTDIKECSESKKTKVTNLKTFARACSSFICYSLLGAEP